MMLGWITFAGVVLVIGILADDWLANRHRRPLSHMKPDPKSLKGYTGMEELDITNANQKIAKKRD
ncbi:MULTISPECIES: hypothetical protein [unclassified Octadecabacter]|uniref:hypothetical protein n=1 Tax=unclassified Octadecabacter TaxID=196158 RepID=UPI001C08E650|nr:MULTISPECIES: hypothetical protein [unclassified Octadecabacter]MBU2993463.1 hypothetical protein [Octadecabacter sp. B2R22]